MKTDAGEAFFLFSKNLKSLLSLSLLVGLLLSLSMD